MTNGWQKWELKYIMIGQCNPNRIPTIMKSNQPRIKRLLTQARIGLKMKPKYCLNFGPKQSKTGQRWDQLWNKNDLKKDSRSKNAHYQTIQLGLESSQSTQKSNSAEKSSFLCNI